jgi:hypothetical protein
LISIAKERDEFARDWEQRIEISPMVASVAKAFVELGRPTDVPKVEWFKEIQRQAVVKYEGLSGPSAFAAFIKNADEDSKSKEDDDDKQDPQNDPAYAKLAVAARNLMKSNLTLSFPSAFSKAVNLNPDLIRASTAVHRAKIAKAMQGKPTVSNGETGDQHPGLSQYEELMERARQIQLEGGENAGRSVASIFSELYQNKGQMVPGPDNGKRGADKATSRQRAERQTETRLRTEKRFNPAQRPLELPGDQGFSFRKA